MKFNKAIMLALMIASILIQGKNAYAASSNSSSIDIDNITPGFSEEEIQSSNDRVNSFTNTFTGSVVETLDKKSSKKKDETAKKDEVVNPPMIANNVIVSTQESTGIEGDFWGRTSNNQWILIENNSPATGWKMVKNKWYYMDFDGVMQTGWLKDNGTWYYLRPNGEMAVNTIINGYSLNISGALI